jgi:hypothetical protein
MRIGKSSLVLPLVLLVGCPGDGDGGGAMYCQTCNLDHWLPALAVEGAVDCGLLRLNADPTAATACVEDVLASGAPFKVRQQLQGIDSRVELGFVVDHDGVVQRLFYDSNICGSATCEGGCGPSVTTTECRDPRVGAMPEQSLVDCDAGESVTLCASMVEWFE